MCVLWVFFSFLFSYSDGIFLIRYAAQVNDEHVQSGGVAMETADLNVKTINGSDGSVYNTARNDSRYKEIDKKKKRLQRICARKYSRPIQYLVNKVFIEHTCTSKLNIPLQNVSSTFWLDIFC